MWAYVKKNGRSIRRSDKEAKTDNESNGQKEPRMIDETHHQTLDFHHPLLDPPLDVS